VIVPILHQKLVDCLRHQMVTEVNRYMHVLIPFRTGRCVSKGLSVKGRKR
jgi:hypothetical protein